VYSYVIYYVHIAHKSNQKTGETTVHYGITWLISIYYRHMLYVIVLKLIFCVRAYMMSTNRFASAESLWLKQHRTRRQSVQRIH